MKPNNDKTNILPDMSSKTLTPQRKHRKLMKDGTSEVWPESVEKVFVEGLRQYWESPWATYSRGRSRWRNQFLVDYLHKEGIERSKKQVASHIQVLRNMWKGEPEFHLVAGGEELFLETGLLAPVKSEEASDASALMSPGYDESDALPGSSPSENFAPLMFPFDQCLQLPSPTHAQPMSIDTMADLYSSESKGLHSIEQHRLRSCSREKLDALAKLDSLNLVFPPSPLSTSSSSSRHSLDHPASPRAAHWGGVSVGSSPRSPPTSLTSSAPSSPSKYVNIASPGTNHIVSPVGVALNSPGPQRVFPTANRLTSLSLWADGMLPFTVPVDAHICGSPLHLSSSVVLRIKLSLPSIDDIRSPPTLHGFHGTVSFSSPWVTSAQCVTSVYTSGGCVAEEIGSFQLVASNVPGNPNRLVTAFLPESSLSRSRWLDATLQTTITQQVVVDDNPLATIIYELDRRYGGSTPSADLITVHKQRVPDKDPGYYSSSLLCPSSPHSSLIHAPYMQLLPRSRASEQTSLSCALTPVDSKGSNSATRGLRPPHLTSSLLY